MSQSHSHAHADHSHGHSWNLYLYVLLALLFLTVITIATIKATLVALFFMHLKDDKPINGLIFVSTLLFLAVFLGFCLIDADSRWDTRPATYKGPVDAPAQPLLNADNPEFQPQVDPRKAPGAKPHSGPAPH